jgi:hypothetical protein
MEVKTRKEKFDRNVSNQNADVFLTITIGNAQIGGSIIKWKDETDILNKGNISNLNLGKGSEIIGKTLEIFTNVLDVNTQTNGIITSNYFHNTNELGKSFYDSVDNDGDVFSFEQEVKFK